MAPRLQRKKKPPRSRHTVQLAIEYVRQHGYGAPVILAAGKCPLDILDRQPRTDAAILRHQCRIVIVDKVKVDHLAVHTDDCGGQQQANDNTALPPHDPNNRSSYPNCQEARHINTVVDRPLPAVQGLARPAPTRCSSSVTGVAGSRRPGRRAMRQRRRLIRRPKLSK